MAALALVAPTALPLAGTLLVIEDHPQPADGRRARRCAARAPRRRPDRPAGPDRGRDRRRRRLEPLVGRPRRGQRGHERVAAHRLLRGARLVLAPVALLRLGDVAGQDVYQDVLVLVPALGRAADVEDVDVAAALHRDDGADEGRVALDAVELQVAGEAV